MIYYNLYMSKLLTKYGDDGMENQYFDTLVVITPADCKRLIRLYPRLLDSIRAGSILFIGTEGVREVLQEAELLNDRIKWIDENSVISFDAVHICVAERMKNILDGRDLPRGITGWYYQQFIKMQYAMLCNNEYYMVWDGDTIPCRELEMFQADTGRPYFDLKYEHHHEYFETMGKILPGFGKVIERSFISEHMIFKTQYMKDLIADIEANEEISGDVFWEKILNSILEEKIQSSAFSEFETYGTYIALKHSDAYALRDWHSFRLGGSFFDIETISDRDFEWLSKDFGAISFEKGHFVREDNRNLFDNPYYQEKLTPKQMLQAAQLEFKEGYKEVWDDDLDAAASNDSSGVFNSEEYAFETEDRLKYLSDNTYKIYDELGDNLIEKNADQAFLCYENAEFLCEDDLERSKIFAKKMKLIDSGMVRVRKAAFVILSYNNSYLIQRCIESIYTNCSPDSFLLIIFDNGSTDEVVQWLTRFGEDHDEAYIILSETNLGFSGGCNEAFKYVPENYDVFFVNNDIRMTANALFWLRMGLYQEKTIGAVGAMQNYMPLTKSEKVSFGAIEQYMEYGAGVNVPMDNPYEEQAMLCGFALLIRRDVFDLTEGFDEVFNPGYLEDDDISLQIRRLGYKLIIAHNSFIYHAGSQSFRNRDDLKKLFDEHRKIIIKKWGFDSRIYGSISDNEMEYIESLNAKGYTKESNFSQLHIGCGCGCMLGHIHYLYPNAKLFGVEENDSAREYGLSCIPIYSNCNMLPYELSDFDEVARDLG